MRVRLLVQHRSANIREVHLTRETLIGRSKECQLRIASAEVSRRHCRIRIGRTEALIEDLGSVNGTLVDGQKLKPNVPTVLPEDSRLEIGPAIFLVKYDLPPGRGPRDTEQSSVRLVSPEESPADQPPAGATPPRPQPPNGSSPTHGIDAAMMADIDFDEGPPDATTGEVPSRRADAASPLPPPADAAKAGPTSHGG